MSTKPYEAQLETALTQCQHVSHDALVDLERGDLVEPMERAKAALERVQEIAETGEADRDFVAMLERERLAEEIIPGVTVGSTEADMAEAGAMSTSDGLGAAKAQAQENYGDDVSPDTVAIFCREFIQHGATNVELGRAVRKLLL